MSTEIATIHGGNFHAWVAADVKMQFQQLGPYRIGRRIGKGGMGAVYEAVHSETGERAAVKALGPQLAMADGFRERFEAEVESLKKLRHEGIVRLYGYGEQEGTLFYAMELVDGTSLEDELHAGRRFNWRDVTHISIQICKALKHAHDHGVVHRDIKPANILVDQEGRAKIADFGIARLFGGNQLTSAGGVLGTADYMSPEQADGRPVTDRCDQYSLGGVMYALLAGRPPFRARSLPEMLQLQRFADPEPVSRYASETPAQLESVIMQLLSKDPEKRFPNVMVLARHMEAMEKGLSRPAANDFALSSGQTTIPPVGLDLDDSLEVARTQAADAGFVTEGREASPPEAGALHDEATRDAPPTDWEGEELEVEPPLSAAAEATSSTSAPAQDHFTTVEEDARHRADGERRVTLVVTLQIALLAICLAALGGGAYYLTRPHTADELYELVAAAAESGDVGDLTRVADDVEEFLTRFPDDERAAAVAKYREEIEISRLERRLQLRLGRQARGEDAVTIEQLFRAAMDIAESDPQRANDMLTAILIVFDDRPQIATDDPSPTTTALGPGNEGLNQELLLELIRRKRDALASDHLRRSQVQSREIRERLDFADEIASRDPARALQIYGGIVVLFQSQRWAKPLVDRAAQGLERLRAVGATSKRDDDGP